MIEQRFHYQWSGRIFGCAGRNQPEMVYEPYSWGYSVDLSGGYLAYRMLIAHKKKCLGPSSNHCQPKTTCRDDPLSKVSGWLVFIDAYSKCRFNILYAWLVVYLPFWKTWVRQLGWWHSQLNGKIKVMFQTTNQMQFFAHHKNIDLFGLIHDLLMVLCSNSWC